MVLIFLNIRLNAKLNYPAHQLFIRYIIIFSTDHQISLLTVDKILVMIFGGSNKLNNLQYIYHIKKSILSSEIKKQTYSNIVSFKTTRKLHVQIIIKYIDITW